MTLNALTTPQEVIDVVTSFFPEATHREIINGNQFLLELTLPGITAPIRVTHSVNANRWRPVLEKMKTEMILNIQPRPQDLAMENYSLRIPLIWQSFQRKKYEDGGGDTGLLLANFLDGVEGTLQQLQQLGLAPEQLRESHTENDLNYFKELVIDVNELRSEDVNRFLQQLERHYPRILEAARVEAVRPGRQNGFQHIEAQINAKVKGQAGAAELMATALFSQRRQNSSAAFLFVGPTGVGKTEMAKTLAAVKNSRVLTLSMNQFQGDHEAGSFFGSPASYIGSEDKPHFAKWIENYNPVPRDNEGSTICYTVTDVVILFDEMEKAHSKLKQSFLTLFDEKFLTVQYTRYTSSQDRGVNVTVKYYFERCLFVCTSNLYQNTVMHAVARGDKPQEIADEFKQMNVQSRTALSFSPEFLGRVTVIPFGPIPRGAIYQSLLKDKFSDLLNKLKGELACKSIEIRDEGLFYTILENKFYGDGTDVRKIEREFNNAIKPPIMRSMVNWEKTEYTELTFYIHDAARLLSK